MRIHFLNRNRMRLLREMFVSKEMEKTYLTVDVKSDDMGYMEDMEVDGLVYRLVPHGNRYQKMVCFFATEKGKRLALKGWDKFRR